MKDINNPEALAAYNRSLSAEENGYKDGLPASQNGLAAGDGGSDFAPSVDDGRTSSRIGQSHRETALATATAIATPDSHDVAGQILANAERFLAFLEGRVAIGEAQGAA